MRLMAFSYKCYEEKILCFTHKSSERRALSQPAFTCSKPTMETPERCMKSVKI